MNTQVVFALRGRNLDVLTGIANLSSECWWSPSSLLSKMHGRLTLNLMQTLTGGSTCPNLPVAIPPGLGFAQCDRLPRHLPEEVEEIEITWDEAWFEASEGLATVRASLSYLEVNDDVVGVDQSTVIADLKAFEQVLSEADTRGIKWHLEVDY
jgi:hypothetical protein